MHHSDDAVQLRSPNLLPTLSLAIIGRPNVGKSTLFNRLLGKKVAITYDEPGVTRDWQRYEGVFQGLSLRLFDTPGLGEVLLPDLQAQINGHIQYVLGQCQGILFIVDGKGGLTSSDRDLAHWIRKNTRLPVMVLANKCESFQMGEAAIAEGARLGFGSPIPLSALHGQGMEDLAQTLRELHKTVPTLPLEEIVPTDTNTEEARGPSLVVVGRPNAGKSTFINRCLGIDRLLTGPQAGITRDAVTVQGSWNGHPFRFVDTAGLRKRSHIQGGVEKLSCQETMHAIVFAEVVVMVLDATRGLERQDLVILEKAIQEGRAIVLALNKWDQVTDPEGIIKGLTRCLQETVEGQHIPLIPISSLTQFGFGALQKAVFQSYKAWNTRLTTGMLNRWLQKVLATNPPPRSRGRPVRLKYIMQIKSRPPTFILYGNQLDEVAESYQRYLLNTLVETFSLEGASVRLWLRSSENPYTKEGG